MSKASQDKNIATLRRLEAELSQLKRRFQMGHELKLQWTPNNGSRSGEITGGVIHIYEADQTAALDTLQHEFIEYVLMNELVAPYKRLINKLISAFEEEMYDRKERLVEKFQELIK